MRGPHVLARARDKRYRAVTPLSTYGGLILDGEPFIFSNAARRRARSHCCYFTPSGWSEALTA